MPKPTYVNAEQAAAELGISQPTMLAKLAAGKILGARKVGARWQIHSPVRERLSKRGLQSRGTLAAQRRLEELERLNASAFEQVKLLVCDIEALPQHVRPASVDHIITDPPYDESIIALSATLARCAKALLRPGGSLLCMVGQFYLPDVLNQLRQHLVYQWELAYLTPGGQSPQIWPCEVNTFWKPLLWLTNGPYARAGHWRGDVVKSAVNDNDKRHHRWGQSESGMADLIAKFTTPGQTILDPFLGGGTTGIVAVSLGRQFIGSDIDPEAITTTRERLAKLHA